MNQSDMATLIAQRCGVSQELAGDALVDLLGSIRDKLAAGERVLLPGIGSLALTETSARTNVRNPRTGAALPDTPAGRRIKFTQAARMKAHLVGTSAARAAE